jgi:hypothetical protein
MPPAQLTRNNPTAKENKKNREFIQFEHEGDLQENADSLFHRRN